MNKFFKVLFFITIYPLIDLYIFMSVGWVITVMWGWFIVPYFELPGLPWPLAIGLLFLCSAFRSRGFGGDQVRGWQDTMVKREADRNNIWVNYFITAVNPWITLGMAWILTLFL